MRTLTALFSNPMLGETFEYRDTKMNFVAEKTSHHPLIMACHAEGEGWEYWATNEAQNKFNGTPPPIKTTRKAIH
jgi:hypothetical protein